MESFISGKKGKFENVFKINSKYGEVENKYNLLIINK